MRCLDQMLMLQPDKKDMILSNMKEALLPLIDKYILGLFWPYNTLSYVKQKILILFIKWIFLFA
jgi:hypothetical protein